MWASLRANVAILSGMGAGLAAFLVCSLAIQLPWLIALLPGVGIGVGAWFILHGMFPYDEDLSDYRLRAQRQVREVTKLLVSIEQMAQGVKDSEARDNIMRGCEVVRDVIVRTQEKSPESVAVTATGFTGYVSSVSGVLATYLVLQDDPSLSGNREAMQRARDGFANYRDIVENSKAQAQRGDILKMNADLKRLHPLSQLTLPEGEDQ